MTSAMSGGTEKTRQRLAVLTRHEARIRRSSSARIWGVWGFGGGGGVGLLGGRGWCDLRVGWVGDEAGGCTGVMRGQQARRSERKERQPPHLLHLARKGALPDVKLDQLDGHEDLVGALVGALVDCLLACFGWPGLLADYSRWGAATPAGGPPALRMAYGSDCSIANPSVHPKARPPRPHLVHPQHPPVRHLHGLHLVQRDEVAKVVLQRQHHQDDAQRGEAVGAAGAPEQQRDDGGGLEGGGPARQRGVGGEGSGGGVKRGVSGVRAWASNEIRQRGRARPQRSETRWDHHSVPSAPAAQYKL
jgi:hypothetical protein